MKIKLLLATSFLGVSLGASAQFTENFDKANLSSGSLACWQSEYKFDVYGSARRAAPAAQSLASDTRLSLNSGTPVNGSASLRVTDSFTIPARSGAISQETFITPARGQDGDVVSFKIRVNSASAFNGIYLYVMVDAGSFRYEREIPASQFNNTVNVATTIDQSMGGGVIKVTILYGYYGYISFANTVSYSLDIDDFTTDAAIDPANTCMTSLPVTLASFSATKSENVVKLHWSTTEETNSDRFEIQRSADAKQWAAIGTKLSSGENNGLLHYQFTDIAPLSGRNYYRLKMLDKDGTHAYSSIRSVETGDSRVNTVLYPNPVVDKIFVQDKDGNQLSNQHLQEISILNLAGFEVYKSSSTSLASNSGIDVKGLAAGMYVLKVKLTDGTQSAHKILVNR